MYTQTSSGEERYSSVDEIVHWISSGPLLRPPTDLAPTNETDTDITTPSYVPATIQYVPTIKPSSQQKQNPIPLGNQRMSVSNEVGRESVSNEVRSSHHGIDLIERSRQKQRVSDLNGNRDSTIGRKPPTTSISLPIGQMNVPATAPAPTCRSSAYVHENLSPPPPRRTSKRIRRLATAYHALGLDDSSHNEDSERFQLVLDELDRLGRNTDGNPNDKPYPPHACFLVTLPTAASELDLCSRPMPKIELPPVFPNRPLNLNLDGTPINYRKSHSGPHAEYWAKAGGEEIERLFVTGIIKPERFGDIPHDKVVTYVNPVCVEKTNDDGSLKFRTRLTIGGDRIQYPYDTAAVTA